MARASGSIRCIMSLLPMACFSHTFLGEFHIMDTLAILYISR